VDPWPRHPCPLVSGSEYTRTVRSRSRTDSRKHRHFAQARRRETRWPASNGPAAALPPTPSPRSAATAPQSTTPASTPPSRSSSPGNPSLSPLPYLQTPPRSSALQQRTRTVTRQPVFCTAFVWRMLFATHPARLTGSSGPGTPRATAPLPLFGSSLLLLCSLQPTMATQFWCDGNGMRFLQGSCWVGGSVFRRCWCWTWE